MELKGSKYPQSIEILKTEKGISTVALRRNVEQVDEIDDLTKTDLVHYKYEEVKVKLKQRPNLVKYIQANFDNWFEKGLKLEALRKEIKEKELEMKKLIEKYKQTEVNDELTFITNHSLLAISQSYEDVVQVQEEASFILLALTEVYELLAGGM